MPQALTVTWTEADVLNAIAAVGVRVSLRQLKRWRREGLVPTPTVVGRGRARGVEARYPAIAPLQAATAALVLARIRRFSDVRWALWGCGFDLTERVRRDLVARWRDEHRAYAERYKAHVAAGDRADESPSPLERLTTHGRRWAHVAMISRRVGRGRAATYLSFEHALRLGLTGDAAPTITDADAPDLLRAIRFYMEPERRPPKPSPEEVSELRVAWTFLSQHLSFRRVGRLLATCPPSWLEQLRAEVDTLARHAGLLSERTDDVIQSDWFLIWFTLRSALGDWSEKFAEGLQQAGLPQPQAPPFLRTVLARRSAMRRTRKLRR